MLSTWTMISKKNKSFDSEEFLRVKPGCHLKVRLIGLPVQVVRVCTLNNECIRVDNEAVARQLTERHEDKVKWVSVRYSCWCIDRETKSLRILDMPRTVAQSFGSRVQILGKSISGDLEGCDWMIRTNDKSGLDVRYEAVYVEDSPLTYVEQKMIEDKKAEGEWDLRKIYSSYSYQEAVDRL